MPGELPSVTPAGVRPTPGATLAVPTAVLVNGQDVSGGRLLDRGPDGWQVVPTGTTEHLVALHGRPGGQVVVLGAPRAVLEVVR